MVKVINYDLRPGESLLDQMVCGYKDQRQYQGHLWAVGKWVDKSGGDGNATSLRLAWRVENESEGFKVEQVRTTLLACDVKAAD